MAFIRNRAGADSKIDINVFYNGGELTRARGTVDATGARSEVRVNEIVFGCSSQRFDINTMILNSGRESNASLESRAVLMDSSFCLLKGYAKVNRGASGSKSYVHERGILLDRGARIDGLPDMSVEESAVKATHSSATSPIDPEAVFYLMSKSIDELGVRRLIVSGFLAESVARMHNQFARDTSMALLDRKLEKKEFGLIPKAGEASWSFGEEGKKDMFLGHYKYR
jgi:Fe-S cluster assembly protein SufD